MLANDYGSWAIATLWSPPRLRTAGSILQWGTGNVGVRAGGNLIREFWPDVKGLFREEVNFAFAAMNASKRRERQTAHPFCYQRSRR